MVATDFRRELLCPRIPPPDTPGYVSFIRFFSPVRGAMSVATKSKNRRKSPVRDVGDDPNMASRVAFEYFVPYGTEAHVGNFSSTDIPSLTG